MKKLFNIIFGKKAKDREYTVVKFEDKERGEFESLIPNDRFEETILEIEQGLKGIENYKDDNFIWCLVGNIIDEHEFGEEKEIRRGTKHFPPNAKVYCFPPLWGDGYEKIQVIGRPRKKRKMIMIVLSSKLVSNWRMMKVYHPYVKFRMLTKNGWDGTDDSKQRIEILLDSLKKWEDENSGEQ